MRIPTYRELRVRLRARRLRPRSRLARFTTIILLVDGVVWVASLVARVVGWTGLTSYLSGWVSFLNFVVAAGVLLLAARWARQKLMWRLRNRLIVTYVFVGVIPVLLLVAMAAGAGYLLAGQFATFVATGDVQAELMQLDTQTTALTSEIAAALERGVSLRQVGDSLHSAARRPALPETLTVWYRGESLDVAGASGSHAGNPAWLKESFRGAVFEADGSHWLRAVRRVPVRGDTLTVIAGVPLGQLLQRLAANLGVITLYTEGEQSQTQSSPNNQGGLVFHTGPQQPPAVTVNGQRVATAGTASRISGGTLSPPAQRFDLELFFGTPFAVTNWNDGVEHSVALAVTTRPSLLYARLFLTLGEISGAVLYALTFIAIFFAVIELLALIIAARLTRSITRSVAQLYDATEHVNRGQLRHRITVRSRDQLATLETSFNSMTASLERLLAEQQEKQRIENELAIAQEVQEQLFPHHVRSLETLEVHGVCRPARTVSGDYYDFLALGQEKLGIAVGDVSGKGISAALLMATIHSAVRAYTMDRSAEAQEATLVAAVGAPRSFGVGEPEPRGDAVSVAPSELLALLNRQLFHSTPEEKYATLFLGTYDGLSRTLTYANGGHLPPIILSPDGSVQRLTVGGMVVGLFDGLSFEQASVSLRPGDLFISFSDGVTEPENEFGEYGEQRLLELVRENQHLPLERISEEVITAVRDWIGGAEQPDDITLVLARAR